MTTRFRFSPLLLLTALACAPGAGTDAGPGVDAGDADGGLGLDAGGEGSGSEEEPNDGTSDEEVNEIALGQTLSGVVSSSGDQDAFRVATLGGGFYRAHLTLPAGSALQGSLTVIDDGRDDDPPSADFVQLSRTGSESDVNLEWLAAGDGHIVVVRDARNLGGGGGSGGEDHTYSLRVEALSAEDVSRGTLSFPSERQDSLAHAGAAAVYRFEAEAWSNALFTLTADGDMDGRMLVIAESTGDWIARNDDQLDSVNPRIDAPLSEGGVLWLVIDNVDQNATDLGYTLSVSLD